MVDMKFNILLFRALIFGLLLATSIPTAGQNPREEYLNSEIKERNFNQEQWQNLVKDLDYTEESEREKAQATANDPDYDEGNFEAVENQRSRSRSSSEAWANFLKILSVVALIGLIVFFVANILGKGLFTQPRNRKIVTSTGEISLENIEENIHESDLDRFIRQAVEQKNFPLAVRLYYLAVIKELSLRQTIRWKKDKTNRDYLNEVRKTSLFPAFREATRIFERVWYGEGELSEENYWSIQPRFADLVKQAAAQDIRKADHNTA